MRRKLAWNMGMMEVQVGRSDFSIDGEGLRPEYSELW